MYKIKVSFFFCSKKVFHHLTKSFRRPKKIRSNFIYDKWYDPLTLPTSHSSPTSYTVHHYHKNCSPNKI